MRIFTPPPGKHHTPVWMIIFTLALPILVVAASLLQPWIDIHHIYRDPVSALTITSQSSLDISRAELWPLIGFASNLGALMWCIAAAVSLFAAFAIRRHADRVLFRCLIASAGISSVLLIDDLFMVHDTFFPIVLGISEKPIFIFYAVMMLLYVAVFRRVIMKHAQALLVLSAVTFALSLAFDIFDAKVSNSGVQHAEVIQRLGEDGLKLMGIFAWLMFVLRLSYLGAQDAIAASISAARATSTSVGLAEQLRRISPPLEGETVAGQSDPEGEADDLAAAQTQESAEPVELLNK